MGLRRLGGEDPTLRQNRAKGWGNLSFKAGKAGPAPTRVTLRTVLASLAAGDSVEEILADFPALKTEDVQAAIAFAAASAEEDLPVPATPHIR